MNALQAQDESKDSYVREFIEEKVPQPEYPKNSEACSNSI